jgi:hypothetical protein
VNKANTTTTVTSSANPDVFGQSITFTATVSPLAPGAGTPTGTVTFLDGGSPIGTGTLSGGVATFTTAALAVGNHTITTSYGGDGNFNGSTGSLTGNPQVVNKTNTTTAVTSPANPSAPGQSVTFTATVSPVAPGSGTPTGTVTFLDGGSPIGTGTLSGGVATFATSALAVGNHTITTSYGGDGNFNGSTGSLNGNPQVVNKANTTSTVTSSSNTINSGQSVTFTAMVSPTGPGTGTPTGTVSFVDTFTSATIGTGTLSGGVATVTTTTLSLGTHTITTSYAGDLNFNGSTSSGVTETVNPKPATTTTVASSANPSVVGQAVTFTATITPTGGGTATGTVTFLDGGSTIGTGTLSGGVATITTSALTAGSHTITTSYPGDGNFAGSTGMLTGNPQVVKGKSTTSTAVTSSLNPSIVGQAVTLTATITPTGGGTATGTVTFLDGGSTIGTGTLSGNVATTTTSALTAGSHTITTSYPGDGNFSGSMGALAAAQVVAVKTTTTSIASSLNPSTAGQAVTFTATVTTTGGGGAPTGTVTFNDGGGTLGTGTLAGGIASFTTSSLAVGSHSITAAINGAGSFGQSTSAVLTQAVGTSTDSLKLRALQVAVTKLESQGSGQAISGVIDGAIADGFEPSNNPISATDNGLHFNFAAEPKEQTSPAKDRVGGAFAALPDGKSPVAKPPPFVEPKVWLAWADIHGSNWNTGLQTGDIRGGQTNATAGITRKLTPDLLIGAFGGYENFDYTSELLGGRLKGNGWTAGGYFGWRVLDGLRFDAGVARSGISYDGTAGTAVGSFPGARWLVTSGLTGIYKTLGFEIEPSARVYAIWENDGAFVDSLGTPQAARNFSSGRASTGAKVTYPWLTLSGTSIAPYAGVFADYYFNQDDAALPNGTPLLPTQFVHGLSARVVSGVGVGLANGPRFTFGGELGGLGNDFKVWSLRGRAAVPF